MTWRVVCRACLTILCVLMFATRAPAQSGTGSLHGRVIDPRGAAVAGARVTIGGPAGELSQLTDTSGRFRFLALPPGSYAVKVEREGVTPAGHPNITVRVGRSTVIEITATPGGHNVLGSSESALLDSRAIATGANLRQEQLDKIPFGPDLTSILQSTPGVMLDVVSVGGSAIGDRPSLAFRGASRDANTWTVDGVTLTDMTAPGLAPRYFEFNLIEEVQTVTGGPDIQQMTGGVGVNIVTKRGTNLFQGQGRAMFSNATGYQDDVQPLGGFDFDSAIAFGAEAGGPIKKDQVWYFVGIDGIHSDRETLAAGEIADQNFTRRSLLGKISLNTGGHVLTGSAHTSGLDRDGEGAGPLRAPGALWNDNGRTTMVKVEDSATLGSRWFVTALAAFTDAGFTADPVGTAATHLDAANVFRDGFQRVTADRTSKEVRAGLTGYFGAHEWQAGLGYRSVGADTVYEWPGGAITAASDTPVTSMILPADRDVSASAGYTSGYIQDTVTHGRLTANLGLRFDAQRGRNKTSAAIANAGSAIVPAATFDGDDPDWSWTSVVPRLGVTYALGRDQSMLVRAAFSRYPDQLGIDRILLGNPILEPPSLVANDLDPPMTNELLFGVDRLVGRGALSAHFQWRTRTGVIDDIPLVIDPGTGLRRQVVAADFGPGPIVPLTDLDGSPVVLETFDLNPSIAYAGGVSVVNGAREHSAVNMTLQYDQRYVRGAYVRAWINVGRAEWSVPAMFFVDANDLIGAEDNDGAPVADRSASPARPGVYLNSNWSYEVLGMTPAPWGLELAGRVYGRQGYPAPVFAAVTSSDATRRIQVGEFDGVRFSRLFVADLRIERAFVVANFNLDLSAEVFNIFNRQTLLQHDSDLRSDTPGAAVELLSPRVMRFGVRVRF